MSNASLGARLARCSACACVALALTLAPAIARASFHMQYYGGHVISHVQVVPVLWGSGVSPAVVSGAEGFYAAILDSPYLDWMGEYDTVGLKGAADMMPGSNQQIHRGTALPPVSIVPGTTSQTVSDAEIQTELLAQIASGKLPAPKVDADGGVDTLYMVAFPPGISINDFSGQDVCSGGCAYHFTFKAPGIAAGVPYGVIPDCSASATPGCALGNGAFDTYTGDASHELAEAITDTECGLVSGTANVRPLAWYEPSQGQTGEIGDICLSASAFVPFEGYLVQTLWSQRLGRCITSDPGLTVCDGTKRPCRPCAPSDCTGTTPRCDSESGVCVAESPTGADAGQGEGGADAGDAATADTPINSAGSGGCTLTPASPRRGWAAWVALVAVVVHRRRRRARREGKTRLARA